MIFVKFFLTLTLFTIIIWKNNAVTHHRVGNELLQHLPDSDTDVEFCLLPALIIRHLKLNRRYGVYTL